MSTTTTTTTKRYLVEHIDPELGDWSALEYRCIAQECGGDASTDSGDDDDKTNESARFWLTSVPPQLQLPPNLKEMQSRGLMRVSPASVEDLLLPADSNTPTSPSPSPSSSTQGNATRVPKSRVCLLDPQSTQDLRPSDAALFDWFLFGGILGDDPPRDRTGELRVKGFPTRRLGGMQMTTDTAVRATRLVIEHGKGLGLGVDEWKGDGSGGGGENGSIGWVDMPEIKVDEVESVGMPFRYVAGADGEPVMPEGMVELIKKDSERGLDDLIPDVLE